MMLFRRTVEVLEYPFLSGKLVKAKCLVKENKKKHILAASSLVPIKNHFLSNVLT